MTTTLYSHIALTLLLVARCPLSVESSACPAQCRCVWDTSTHVHQQHVDCSGQLIPSLDSILPFLSTNTTVLDLRVNHIRVIPSDAFKSLPNLSIILLDDNFIEEVEAYAFRGLSNVTTVSLTNNRLRLIRSESFSHMSGSEATCSAARRTGVKQCGLYLVGNNVETIEKYSFAWLNRLDVHLGHSTAELTIDAYAFYGVRSVAKLVVERIPRLTLHPRIFTNTENIDSIEISQTEITRLHGFVFEGLKNVQSIVFNQVRIHVVGSYALSGVVFTSVTKEMKDNDAAVDVDENLRTNKENMGGLVSFTDCHLDELHTDILRDTHLAKIRIENSHIVSTQSNVFRGIVGLQSIHLVRNRIDGLKQDSLGSLRHLDELIIQDNNLTAISNNTFSETSDVGTIRIILRQSTTLEKEAFSGVFNVKNIEIYGSSNGPKPALHVQPGAFRNLVGVEVLRVSDVDLPGLGEQSFSGMSRVKTLYITNCGVAQIDRHAFGEPYSYVGSIDHIDMSVGNNLTCDCQTREVFRDLTSRFSTCSLACKSPNDLHALPVKVDSAALSHLSCSPAASRSSFNKPRALLTVLLVFVLHLLIFKFR